MGKKIKDVKKFHNDFSERLVKINDASNKLKSALDKSKNPDADMESDADVKAACSSLDTQLRDLSANMIFLVYAGC
ncbi:MAG: hypothetical protein P8Z49_06360 [Acidobacteriota bacterium]|jgi:hypothetical protein